jgi:hypothetical protein
MDQGGLRLAWFRDDLIQATKEGERIGHQDKNRINTDLRKAVIKHNGQGLLDPAVGAGAVEAEPQAEAEDRSGL